MVRHLPVQHLKPTWIRMVSNISAQHPIIPQGMVWQRGLSRLLAEFMPDTGSSVREKLAKFLFKYRITPHLSTGVAPAELLMGRTGLTEARFSYNNRKQSTEAKAGS